MGMVSLLSTRYSGEDHTIKFGEGHDHQSTNKRQKDHTDQSHNGYRTIGSHTLQQSPIDQEFRNETIERRQCTDRQHTD